MHPQSGVNPARDMKEALVYEFGLKNGIPMAGICRGGQFLNVMNGGKMWQHVDNHGVSNGHDAIDAKTGEVVLVSSTHHQMMIPGKGGDVLLFAHRASFREKMGDKGVERHPVTERSKFDTEAVIYPGTRSLCFQPHPEFQGWTACRDLFFRYLDQLLGE